MFKRWTRLTLFVVIILALSLSAALAQESTPEPAPPEETEAAPDPAGPGYLGIAFEPAAIITEVMPGTPAEDAGLLPGDRIVAVNDEPVNADTLTLVIGQYLAGETVTLSVMRDGETLEIELTLAERPPGFVPAPRQMTPRGMMPPDTMPRGEMPRGEMRQFRMVMQPYLGVTLDLIDEAVTITSVAENSPAEDAGLLAEDIIVSVNGEAVSTVEAVVDVVRSAQPGDVIVLGIERDDESLEIEATLGGPLLFDREGRPFGQMIPMPRGEFPRNFRFDGIPLERAFLGVQFDIVDEGALIVEVVADSPADEAGLLADDVVVSVDGVAVAADNTLGEIVAGYEPGDTVTLLVIRDGETLEIEATLGQRSLFQDDIIIIPEPEPEPELPEMEDEASV